MIKTKMDCKIIVGHTKKKIINENKGCTAVTHSAKMCEHI